ncbi:hypothetical protein EVAR_92384_1 [Eumeta japonica]|uniref:Uncharacterized protein n=1 Tax=Eumeta variegata TaxID=151549 RepID=A0A4C1TJV0_EUMVA|nr:hypothetical protein EVAR_92384_1 [Eumeta japonica]
MSGIRDRLSGAHLESRVLHAFPSEFPSTITTSVTAIGVGSGADTISGGGKRRRATAFSSSSDQVEIKDENRDQGNHEHGINSRYTIYRDPYYMKDELRYGTQKSYVPMRLKLTPVDFMIAPGLSLGILLFSV